MYSSCSTCGTVAAAGAQQAARPSNAINLLGIAGAGSSSQRHSWGRPAVRGVGREWEGSVWGGMPGALAGLLARFRTADPLNVYIAVTSAGIVWVVGEPATPAALSRRKHVRR
jgi:hypothetical protein